MDDRSDPDLEVDYGRARQLAARLESQCVTAIVVSGTTGESPTLTREDKIELIRVLVGGLRPPLKTASDDVTRQLRQALSGPGPDVIDSLQSSASRATLAPGAAPR